MPTGPLSFSLSIKRRLLFGRYNWCWWRRRLAFDSRTPLMVLASGNTAAPARAARHAARAEQRQIYNLVYAHADDAWKLTGYLQLVNVPPTRPRYPRAARAAMAARCSRAIASAATSACGPPGVVTRPVARRTGRRTCCTGRGARRGPSQAQRRPIRRAGSFCGRAFVSQAAHAVPQSVRRRRQREDAGALMVEPASFSSAVHRGNEHAAAQASSTRARRRDQAGRAHDGKQGLFAGFVRKLEEDLVAFGPGSLAASPRATPRPRRVGAQPEGRCRQLGVPASGPVREIERLAKGGETAVAQRKFEAARPRLGRSTRSSAPRP